MSSRQLVAEAVPELRRFFRQQYCNMLAARSYVDRSLVRRNAEWLLILTFPNGGSTAFAKLLLTSPNTVALRSNAEGQWLIPALYRAGRRWDPNHMVSSRMLRAVWLSTIKVREDQNILVVEKSPPNLCRYPALRSALAPMRVHLMTFSRDPYATCASWQRRYRPERVAREWGLADAWQGDELAFTRALARVWLQRAELLVAARPQSLINLSYEHFTENVPAVVRALEDALPLLRGISPDAKVQVKDYEMQKIKNFNDEQIALLTPRQVDAISMELAKNGGVVQQLGYAIR